MSGRYIWCGLPASPSLGWQNCLLLHNIVQTCIVHACDEAYELMGWGADVNWGVYKCEAGGAFG